MFRDEQTLRSISCTTTLRSITCLEQTLRGITCLETNKL